MPGPVAARVACPALSAAALLGSLASGVQVGPCFDGDMAYLEGSVTASIPNAGFYHNPSLCQGACQARGDTCTFWSWTRNGDASSAVGPGGCWVVGPGATLHNMTGYVAGPRDCPPNNTVVTLAPLPSTVVPTAAPTAVPLPPAPVTAAPAAALPAVPGANGTRGMEVPATPLPGLEPLPPVAANGSLATPGPAAEGLDEGEGGGFPWWTIVLAGAVAAGIIGLIVWFVLASSEGRKAPSKKKVKRAARPPPPQESLPDSRTAPETIEEVTAPLIPPSRPAPEPLPTAAAPLPQYNAMPRFTTPTPLQLPGYGPMQTAVQSVAGFAAQPPAVRYAPVQTSAPAMYPAGMALQPRYMGRP